MTDLIQIKIKRDDYPRLVAHGVASSRLQVSGMGGVGMANDPANRATRFIVIVIK